jgi:serine/threonine protein kinase
MTEIPPDYPDICFAGESGFDCYCLACTTSKAVEESIFEQRSFASGYAANSSRSNDLSVADVSGTSVTGGTPWSLEPTQTTSYPYSALSRSSVTQFMPSSYASMRASYSSSSMPLNMSSSGYLGGPQSFEVASGYQGFPVRASDLRNFAVNTSDYQNMRVSESGSQGIRAKSRPRRKPPRPRQSRATVTSLVPNSSNVPDSETFLQAQEYLDLQLKRDNTLVNSKKEPLAEILGISTAQLELCIKAKREIFPILNELMSKAANLGVPTDHVVQWIRKVETQSSTEESTTDSAYRSLTNPLSNEHKPNKKRKIDARDENSSKPFQCTHIDSNRKYCLREFTNFTDWKRHEEIHWPQKRWECLIQEYDSTISCHVCSGNIDLVGQQLVNHHAGCRGTYRRGHDFARKDKLQLHVKNHHHCEANVDTWYANVPSDWKQQCGFCGSRFTEWNARCEHVGQHFMEGKRMIPDWKDPWPLGSGIFSQGGDDDDDNHDDNHDDNSNKYNTHQDEHDQDPNNHANKSRRGPGGFQEGTSNKGTSSDYEGKRQMTSFKSDNHRDFNSGPQETKRRIGETGNGPSSLYSPRPHGDREAKNSFKHIRKLGYGAFGAVDEVEHCASKIHFARKTIRVSQRLSDSSLAQAQREVTALRRLKHQHIINVLASYSWDGHFAIIMFPVAERNLSEFLLNENATTLPHISKLSTWLGCLISAVSYIHGHSCYHMDIKPNNILISRNQVMLADFGGALITNRSQSKNTQESTSIITPMYCAPEIADRGASPFLPGASDIFSLGCVFLEMVTIIYREKLRTFVDFRTFRSINATYSSNSWKTSMWIVHLSYINESLGLPRQNWLQVVRRMLSVDSKKRPTAQDIVRSYLIHNVQEKREKPDGEKYVVLSDSNDSLALIEAARFWLEECRTSHQNCNFRIPMNDFVPSRLLDVGTYTDSIHLQSTFVGFPSQYVTLSHCWGDGGEILQTTKQTLKRMSSGIEISSLPATFADAVRVTKALGFKYLWIDSLCIIQDSEEDWMTECSLMGKIYSHSSLTISAVSGRQYSLNIEPGVQHYKPVLDKSEPLCYSCSNGHTGFESLSEDTATTMLLDSPLSQRGWTLQERLLSRRILHFSSTSMAWECTSLCTTFDTVSRIGKALSLQFVQQNPTSHPKIDLLAVPAQFPNKYMTIWNDIVREYSKRKLSRPQDKLPALAGIASDIAEKTGHTYLAGLWAEHLLPTGLLWSRDFATTPLPRPEYRAPSWSWASISSPVVWSKSLPEGNVAPEAEIIHCQISLSSNLSPFGAVSGGSIEIKGPLKRVTVTRVGSELLLKRPSLTPFAFAQWDALEDEQETARLDRIEENKGWMLWCLKIVKGVGLILIEAREKKPEYFERVGIFWIQDEWASESEMSDEWELRTITLV